MTITLDDHEAQRYLDYHYALLVAKEDSCGEVVTSDKYNEVITELHEALDTITTLEAELNAIKNVDTYIEDLNTTMEESTVEPQYEDEKYWTKEEEETLRKYVGKTADSFTVSHLADRLDRTEHGVRAKANRMGYRILKNRIVHPTRKNPYA